MHRNTIIRIIWADHLLLPLVCKCASRHCEHLLRSPRSEIGSEATVLAGFAANMAVLTAFAASPECAIFSDALNHASIVDGARLAARSGAEVRVFR